MGWKAGETLVNQKKIFLTGEKKDKKAGIEKHLSLESEENAL